MIFKNFFLFFCLFFLPYFCFGQIIFSEILFDAEGTDAGYEWVEIKNTKNTPINLKDYKFCEGTSTISCRNWSEENTNFEIGGNSFGIITDDREKFQEKYFFDGLVLETSSFTLNNTGENIEIKNPQGNKEDFLKYNPESGGKNGDTLSVFSNFWKNSVATAGSENIEKTSASQNTKTQEEEKINTSYVEISSDKYLGKKKISAKINPATDVIAGAKTKFSAKAFGLSGVEISGVDFSWNFGDGKKAKGQNAFHEFIFPGEYFVSVFVKSGNFSEQDKIKIKVIDPSLEISDVRESKKSFPGYLELKNNSPNLLNIGGWILEVDGEKFQIPENTFIEKNSKIILPNKNTDLWPENNQEKKSRVFLKFPNGKIFFSYSFFKKEVAIKKPVLKKKILEKKPAKILKKKEEEKMAEPFFPQKNQENFSSEKYFIKKIPLQNSKNFLLNSWPFFSYILFLFFLIILVFYHKKKSKNFDEIFSEKKTLEKYQNQIEKKAKEFDVEEI